MAKYWDNTIRGTWEANVDGTEFRLYRTPTYHLPTGCAPYIANIFYFKKDGSEIGRKFQQSFGSIDIYGSLPYYSSHTFAADFFPLLDSVYYPEPIVDTNGGWKYKPLDPTIPATVTDPTIPFGFLSDMNLSIYENQNNRPEAQITGITFDTRWDTFYLSVTATNNTGNAIEVDYTTQSQPRNRYYVGFQLSWLANWRTFYDYGGNLGNRGLRITGDIPDQIPYGTYTALELIENGFAGFDTSDGNLILTGSGMYSHYTL